MLKWKWEAPLIEDEYIVYYILNIMPGTSGVLSPFGKINGLYFNDSREPDDYMYNFKQDISKIMKEDGVEYVEILADNKEQYYEILDKLSEFNNNITISGTSKNKEIIIIENDDKDESEESNNDEK